MPYLELQFRYVEHHGDTNGIIQEVMRNIRVYSGKTYQEQLLLRYQFFLISLTSVKEDWHLHRAGYYPSIDQLFKLDISAGSQPLTAEERQGQHVVTLYHCADGCNSDALQAVAYFVEHHLADSHLTFLRGNRKRENPSTAGGTELPGTYLTDDKTDDPVVNFGHQKMTVIIGTVYIVVEDPAPIGLLFLHWHRMIQGNYGIEIRRQGIADGNLFFHCSIQMETPVTSRHASATYRSIDFKQFNTTNYISILVPKCD